MTWDRRSVSYVGPDVPPHVGLPWDVAAVAQAALDVLRLTPEDADAARIETAAMDATELIDAELDYEVAPASIPGPVINAAVTLTVELYRRKDAPFGVTDAWSIDGASIHISADVMRGTRSMLSKYKSRRGVA